ncbi:16S rRNA (guanine(527)-N(7))-methyltransferase RsmG [Arachidicoccus ginsenosidivorans]|jgi:16S rRNA (guanine527-N7)-methyltransferase|uniref:Ribosomal RNA small subunit methyltransferase G n=1 Tax=Arachidicoccus ginsenosidivorans TaxID=496057 RepID=A0A5B8VJH7_9BACT|nr:16S rRNA (guanine(527)-N(7))-methyltransferase RsmG [Arachidicoccus ginsenosidivorans]QEC71201.1 16S rRNA (guanine(527)-N(7))-methyltransferase RsmG [Arachidicoccus ginsenosidivorans]
MTGVDILQQYFSGFTQQQIHQFEALGKLYPEWNEKINVISRKDIDSLYTRHILHSLSIAAIIEFKPGTQIIDIGCGGGLPGIPLAIFFPEVSFHLVDSINKKLTVVREISAAIGLKNITVEHTRAEQIRDRQFDFVVSRAVTTLKNLWQWGKPLIRKGKENELPNGLICLKGGDLAEEISQSGLRPHIYKLDDIFDEEIFEDKFLLHVKKG